MKTAVDILRAALKATDGFVNDHDYICQCRPIDLRRSLKLFDEMAERLVVLERERDEARAAASTIAQQKCRSEELKNLLDRWPWL